MPELPPHASLNPLVQAAAPLLSAAPRLRAMVRHPNPAALRASVSSSAPVAPASASIDLRTSAIAFGRFDVAAVMLCYAVFLGGMVGVGLSRHLGALYYAGLAAALGCALWHWQLIRGRDRTRCFAAFLHNHWLGFAVFAGVAADSAWRLNTWPRGF